MTATVLDLPQGSPEWKAARAGRLTASLAADVLATTKTGGEAAKRRDLRLRLVCERLTGVPQDDGYINHWMQRGLDLEPQARAVYEAYADSLTEEVGFVAHTELLIGCSPDGFLDGRRGGVELKVPKTSTHLTYLREGVVPRDYLPQLLHSLWVTDAEFWDFCSYGPELPAPLRLFVVRLERNAAQVADYAQKARTFLHECEVELDALRTLADLKGTLHAAAGGA